MFVVIVSSGFAQFQPCNRGDPNINVCIKNLVNSIYKNARFGRSEYNPASNDLIKVDKLSIESATELDMRGSFDSILARGLKNLEITEVKSDISVSILFHY